MSQKTHYVFGPVPSRRLGISLGIDIIPFKTCSLNCLYCECGPTNRLTLERHRFADPQEILKQIGESLVQIPYLDYITFSGSGEPTLNSDLGYLIAEIKKISRFPVAVLTNGTLFFQEDVRCDLSGADLMLPSLDAATPEGFRMINQPHPGLDINRIIEGQAQFRREYSGQIWLEVFLLENVNTDERELDALHDAIKRIGPDRVQLNTLDRPPAFPGVRPTGMAFLEDVKERWRDLPLPVEIIKRIRRREEVLRFSRNLENSLLNTLSRRPLTVDDLVAVTGINKSEIFYYIDILEKEKKIRPIIVGTEIFYQYNREKPDQ